MQEAEKQLQSYFLKIEMPKEITSLKRITLSSPTKQPFVLTNGSRIKENTWQLDKNQKQGFYLLAEESINFAQFLINISGYNDKKKLKEYNANLYIFKNKFYQAPYINIEDIKTKETINIPIKIKAHIPENNFITKTSNDNVLFFLENVPEDARLKNAKLIGDGIYSVTKNNLPNLSMSYPLRKIKTEITFIASLVLEDIGFAVSSSAAIKLKIKPKEQKVKISKKKDFFKIPIKKRNLEETTLQKIKEKKELVMIEFLNTSKNICFSKGYKRENSWLLMPENINDIYIKTTDIKKDKIKLKSKVYTFKNHGEIKEEILNITINMPEKANGELMHSVCQTCQNKDDCYILQKAQKTQLKK